MQQHTLDGRMDRVVEINLCEPCQAVWFDGRESLQLTAGATLKLFRVIGERVGRPAPQDHDVIKCPRCRAHLRRIHDMQRTTRFEYFRCPNDHGRLTTFCEFLKEKDFIRPMTATQIAELRQSIATINCSNCGASIELSKRADCAHCGSPLSMLDLHQAERLVAELRDADRGKPIDPALPLALARARRQAEAAFRDRPHGTWSEQVASLGLIGAGMTALMRLLDSTE